MDATSASESQYALPDTTYITDDSTRNFTTNESHRINLNFETKLDSLTTLQIKPSATIDKGKTDNSQISNFFDADRVQTLGTVIENNDDSKGYTIGGFARINRKFMKKKRELELRYDIDMNDNATDGQLYTGTSYYSTLLQDTSFTQSKLNNNSNTNHYGTLTYVEPIAKRFKVELEYLFQYGFSNQDKSTFDYDAVTDDYSTLNEGLSNIFDNTRIQHRGGVKFVYESSKHTVDLGVKVRNIDILNVNQITDSTIDQNFTNVLPQFRYQFKPSMSKRLSVNYRTSSQQPSINDYAPVPDNSNPNRIQIGNPDLRPNYMHSLNVMFNTWKALTGRYVWAGASVTYTDDAFATATEYDTYGRTQMKTVNVDGNVMAFVYSGAGFPFFGRKIELSPGFNSSYFRNTNFISGSENVTDNYALTPSLEVDFNLLGDSLELWVDGSYSFNNAISSLTKVATPYSIENYGAGFEWRLPMGFKIGADAEYTKNSQPGDGFYDTEFFVLNAEISKRFLKTENLEVAIKGNDILNQNINARREVNGNIITDYRTTIISRYFLLKLTFRFNNRGAKEEDGNGWH